MIVEGEASSSAEVLSGVPQGTVLGPLLFLCFINDLPQQVKSQVRLFADDCLLYRPVKSITDQIQLQKDLTALEVWADTWGMRFNAEKCYILRVARGRKVLEHMYELCGLVLKQVPNSPYLGVVISEDLSWSSHINKVKAKANLTLAFLRRNLKRCPATIKKTAFTALVRSLVEYSSTVWDPYHDKEIADLEMIQRRGARFVFNNYSRQSSVSNMLEELSWAPLAERRRDARLTMLFKIVGNLIAIPADEYLTKPSSRTRSSTSNNYRQYTTDTTIYANSFFPRTIKDWNSLPQEIKTATTISQFKEGLTERHWQ